MPITGSKRDLAQYLKFSLLKKACHYWADWRNMNLLRTTLPFSLHKMKTQEIRTINWNCFENCWRTSRAHLAAEKQYVTWSCKETILSSKHYHIVENEMDSSTGFPVLRRKTTIARSHARYRWGVSVLFKHHFLIHDHLEILHCSSSEEYVIRPT